MLGVSASFNYAPGQVVPLPTPKLPKAPVTWRAPAVQLHQMANTQKKTNPKSSQKPPKQAVATSPAQPSLPQQHPQAEPSGFMSTESDSDSPAQINGKGKVCTCIVC